MSFVKNLFKGPIFKHNYQLVYTILGAYGAIGYFVLGGKKETIPPPPPAIVPKYLEEIKGNKYETGRWEWDDAEGFFNWLEQGDNVSKWEASLE